MSNDPEIYMRRALSLAEATIGLASPNPQVGCIIVRGNIILGEGAHLYDKRDHAEIVALQQAGPAANGSTAYVTLEPCSHHSRTAPCADALIAAGISRVVVATVDPNPQVAGRGIARLRAAGVDVSIGLCQSEARTLNDAFALSITRNRPFVTLKSALSVDGRIAPPPGFRTPNQPYLLTGPTARAQVQRLRHAHDAILTGIGTVLADDPFLTDRSGLPRRRPLQRIVLDSRLQIPPSSKLVQNPDRALWIFCGPDAPPDRRQALDSLGIKVTEVSTHRVGQGIATLVLSEILQHLHACQVTSLLLEAGSGINGAFLRADLVDRATLFYAEIELGPQALEFATEADGTFALSPFRLEQRMLSITKRTFGPDVCVSGLLHDPWATTPAID